MFLYVNPGGKAAALVLNVIFHFSSIEDLRGISSIVRHDRCSGEPYNFTRAKNVIIQILKI